MGLDVVFQNYPTFDRRAIKKVIIRELDNGEFILEISATKAVMMSKNDLQELMADIIKILAKRGT